MYMHISYIYILLIYIAHARHQISQVLAALHREGWDLELPEVEAAVARPAIDIDGV